MYTFIAEYYSNGVVKVFFFFDIHLGWSNRLHIIEFCHWSQGKSYSLQNPMKPVCKPNPPRWMYLYIYTSI